MASRNPLTPEQRSLRAKAAAHALHASVDEAEHLEPANEAGPGRLNYWLAKVDPDCQLSEPERTRRAEQAKKSYYYSLALKSAKVRRKATG